MCAALASDPDGVVRAEALALEIADRLTPWRPSVARSPLPDDGGRARFLWRGWAARPFRILRPGKYGSTLCPLVLEAVARAAKDADLVQLGFGWNPGYPDGDESADAAPSTSSLVVPWAEHDGYVARAWPRLVERKARVPPNGLTRPLRRDFAAHGERFAVLRNPFEPMAALWQLGYQIDTIDQSAINLAMPV
jgi:hypothetical protein